MLGTLTNSLAQSIELIPGLRDCCYKISKIIVRTHDNDCNYDIYSNGEYYLLQHLIRKKLLDVVFDIGANIGNYSQIIIDNRNSDDGKLYLFDPRDSNIETIKKRFKSTDGVFVIQKALSDYNGTIDFYQNPDPNRSGSDSVYNMTNIGYSPETKKSSAPCITLDSFCCENNINHINFMKIDVEGHELNVLKGAESIILKHGVDYIQFEYGHAARAARVLLLDIVSFLQKSGYSLYVLRPKGIKQFIYSPWEENRYNMINFLAVLSSAPDDLSEIVIK